MLVDSSRSWPGGRRPFWAGRATRGRDLRSLRSLRHLCGMGCRTQPHHDSV